MAQTDEPEFARDDWLVRAAEQLGVGSLNEVEATALLDAARDIAHNTERRYAPLTCFLLGVAAANDRGTLVAQAQALAALARGD
ncbi:MAG: hypothetical protein ACI867_001595 [Glaciecola sp.]|jgi:uncharacterized protein HemY